MNYDSNAFLAGLAVGRRLKGWASGGDLAISVGASSNAPNIEINPVVVVPMPLIPIVAVRAEIASGQTVRLGDAVTIIPMPSIPVVVECVEEE